MQRQEPNCINSTLLTLKDAEYSFYDLSLTFCNIPSCASLTSTAYLFIPTKSIYKFQTKSNTQNTFTQDPPNKPYLVLQNQKHMVHPITLNYAKGLPSFGFMCMIPKMIEMLDDEQKEQMQRQMETQSDPSKMLNQLWGKLSGGDEMKVTRRGKRDELLICISKNVKKRFNHDCVDRSSGKRD